MDNITGFKKVLNSIFENTEQMISYIPYKDSEGNELKADEIFFTNEEGFQGQQTLEVWEEDADAEQTELYTINSPGVEYVFDSSGNFPIALISPKGERMYLKISGKTGEILPTHAGCCKSLDIIYTGASHTGKTVNILQMSNSSFHDAIARHTNCSFEDDLPFQSEARRRYEKAGNDLKKHILPEPTRRGECIMPYVYYFTYTDKFNKERRHVLVRLQDIDGEQCVDMSWKSKIIPYDYFFLMIGADELIEGEKEQAGQYTKVADQLIQKLRVFREQEYEVIVIISKADLLDKENPYLKEAFTDNSISMVDEKMYQTVHDRGFNYDVFNRREKSIERFLEEKCPNFCNTLKNVVPEENITFCMIASIGESGDENKTFEQYTPFCVDEPILSVLVKQGMYPISVYDQAPEEESVKSGTNGKCSGFVNRLIKKLQLDEGMECDVEAYEEE